MDYKPFGQDLSGASGMPANRFANLFRDGEADLDYAQARSYQARTGRFNAPDPVYAGLFNPQRWNRYAYARNNPVGFVDPSGLTDIQVTVVGKMPPNVDLRAVPLRNTGGSGGGASDLMLVMDDSKSVVDVEDEQGNATTTTTTTAPQGTNIESTNNCTDYVETVSEWISGGTRIGGTRGGLVERGIAVGAGTTMQVMGVLDVMQQDARGFKKELTAAGQGNDVYKHMNFMIGSTVKLDLMSAATLVTVDLAEALFRSDPDKRAQAVVELQNDVAGIRAGGEALRAVITRDFQRFERNVKKQVCR